MALNCFSFVIVAFRTIVVDGVIDDVLVFVLLLDLTYRLRYECLKRKNGNLHEGRLIRLKKKSIYDDARLQIKPGPLF